MSLLIVPLYLLLALNININPWIQHAMHKKWSFLLRISSINVTKSAMEEILDGKLHFLCSDVNWMSHVLSTHALCQEVSVWWSLKKTLDKGTVILFLCFNFICQLGIVKSGVFLVSSAKIKKSVKYYSIISRKTAIFIMLKNERMQGLKIQNTQFVIN